MIYSKNPESSERIAMRLYTIAYRCYHDGKASLHGIFAAEDSINRSYPFYKDLELELRVLLSSGLIKSIDDYFEITDIGMSYYERANQTKGSVFAKLKTLDELLNEKVVGLKLNTDKVLEETTYRDALKSYPPKKT